MTVFSIQNSKIYGEYQDSHGQVRQIGVKERVICRNDQNQRISVNIIRDAIKAQGDSFKMMVMSPVETVSFPSGEPADNLNYCYVKIDSVVFIITPNPDQ